MEKRDLYDIDKKLTGEFVYKGVRTPVGRYILVVLVFIQNSDGKFLIQKRSKEKNGKMATTGGHPKSGEDSIQGIITEVKEEIGLDIKKEDLQLYFSGRNDEKRAFWDDYYVKMDIDNIENLKIQKEEVESLHWFSEEEIKELMSKGEFFENHYEEFENLLEWLKSK